MTGRRRLDQEVVRRELATDTTHARELIEKGKVLVGGAPTTNPARQAAPGEAVVVIGPGPQYVSRGGDKLEGALANFAIDVLGKRTLDVGASTGGFTDCLLQHGAASVVAIDVGHAQLHEHIRADERVDVRERFNARHATLADFANKAFPLIVVDVSFISLRTLAPMLTGPVAAVNADLITLIKPQFEAGKQDVSKGRGVVKDAKIWKEVLLSVIATMSDAGAATMGVMISPLVGAEGNVEFFAHFKTHQTVEVARSAQSALDINALLAGVQR